MAIVTYPFGSLTDEKAHRTEGVQDPTSTPHPSKGSRTEMYLYLFSPVYWAPMVYKARVGLLHTETYRNTACAPGVSALSITSRLSKW